MSTTFTSTPPAVVPAVWASRTACRLVATANVTISTMNNGDTIDGVVIATSDRILLTGQTDAKENGIYTVGATEGTSARTTESNQTAEFALPFFVEITAGTHKGERWYLATPGITLGTDNITISNSKDAPQRVAQCAAFTSIAPAAISQA